MQHTLPYMPQPLRSYFRVHASHHLWNFAGHPATLPSFLAGNNLPIAPGMGNVPSGLDVVQAMVEGIQTRPGWLRRRLLVLVSV